MSSTILRTLTIILFLFSLKVSSLGGTYQAPQNSIELFRLEKIPLEVLKMKELSAELQVLASGIIKKNNNDNSVEELRAASMLIALAIQLDPLNKSAQKLNKSFLKGNFTDQTSAKKIQQALSEIQHTKKWLASREAGKDANLLAHYLSDATKVFDPKTRHQKDLASWKGVVPSLEQYKRICQKTETKNTDAIADNKTSASDEKTNATSKNNNGTTFHLTEITLKLPLKTSHSVKYLDKKDNVEKSKTVTHSRVTPVTIKISTWTKDKTFEIVFSPGLPWLSEEYQRIAAVKRLTTPVITLLKSRHKSLPNNRATVSTGKGQYTPINGQSLTGGMAVMLEASLTNQKLRNDLVICANIDSQGNFHSPVHFWDLLKILRENKQSGRLIIAEPSSEILYALPIHDELDFFTRWEIFTVKNLDDAMAIATEKGSTDLTEASELFASIQRISKKSSIKKLILNRAVKKRLAEIKHLAPNLFSAKILLLQGSSKRIKRLPTKLVGYELLPILNNLNEKISDNIGNKKYAELKKMHLSFRKDLKEVEPFVDRLNDAQYQKTLEIIDDIRHLASLKRRIERDSSLATALKKNQTTIVQRITRECNGTILEIKKLITPVTQK